MKMISPKVNMKTGWRQHHPHQPGMIMGVSIFLPGRDSIPRRLPFWATITLTAVLFSVWATTQPPSEPSLHYELHICWMPLALNHDYSACQVAFALGEFAPFLPSTTKNLCSVTGRNPFVVAVLGVPGCPHILVYLKVWVFHSKGHWFLVALDLGSQTALLLI